MYRSFSNAKVVTAFIATRRGFATASEGVALRNGAPNVTNKGSEESGKTSWVPDPVTGHYRPDKQPKETDPVELRDVLVENKNKEH